jgi:hypothetical protein
MERNSREDTAEVVTGIAGVLTAGGVLTFALFPLLLPTVVLLAALALPLLPLALVGAVLAGAFVVLRGLGRWVRGGIAHAGGRERSARLAELRAQPR